MQLKKSMSTNRANLKYEMLKLDAMKKGHVRKGKDNLKFMLE